MERKHPLDPAGILGVLHGHGVDFVLIGGLAVIAHGSTRVTQDIDVTPRPDDENLGRLAEAVRALEGELIGIDEEIAHDVLPDLDGLRMGGNFCLDTRAGGLDIMQYAEGCPPYDELVAEAIEVTITGVPVKVAGIDHLIRMKTAAGRPKDREDIATLTGSAGELEPAG